MAKSARLFFLPYCIKQSADGTYIVLNRNYKPVGFVGTEHIVYEDYPIGFLPKKSPEIAFQGLSWDSNNTNFQQVFLYNDQCIPTKNKAHWSAYTKRLDILANLEIKTFAKASSGGTTRDFERWLLQFIDENSALGDLAGDIQRDDAFPALGNSIEPALRYVSSGVHDALQEAWQLYCAENNIVYEPQPV